MLASSCRGVNDMAVKLYVHRRRQLRGAMMSSHVARRQSGMFIMGSLVSGAMKHSYGCPRTAACMTYVAESRHALSICLAAIGADRIQQSSLL